MRANSKQVQIYRAFMTLYLQTLVDVHHGRPKPVLTYELVANYVGCHVGYVRSTFAMHRDLIEEELGVIFTILPAGGGFWHIQVESDQLLANPRSDSSEQDRLDVRRSQVHAERRNRRIQRSHAHAVTGSLEEAVLHRISDQSARPVVELGAALQR